MIIKNIHIRNFRSYYGDNSFDFSNGLTLIIGDNGDGKTYIDFNSITAVDWKFKNGMYELYIYVTGKQSPFFVLLKDKDNLNNALELFRIQL